MEIQEKVLMFAEKNKINKHNIIRHIKFLLIPGWRDKEFTAKEYETEKIKSKRRIFRRLITPLTATGFIFIFFITFLAVYSPWLTPFTIYRVTEQALSGASPYIYPPQELNDIFGNGFIFLLIPLVLGVLRKLKKFKASRILKIVFFLSLIGVVCYFAVGLLSIYWSVEHPFGTTAYGYDLLGRMIWGARTAIVFGFITIIIASGGGIVVGTVSGYYGGRVDSIIMRIIDFVMIFPATVLVILLVELQTEQNLLNILMIFGVFAITGYARLMRASVLQVKQELYIEAAKTGGANKFKIMFKHVFSNAISPIIISFFGGVGGAILAFSGIAFLGFGDQSLPDWGTDISWASARLSALHATIWPGLFILISVLGFMLIGDGLRDALDPRLQQTKK